MRDLHPRLSAFLPLLAILGFATTVHAQGQGGGEPKLYNASLVLHSFANDATGALQALPLGEKCNPGNGGGTTCYTTTLHQGAPLTGSGTAKLLKSASGPTGFRIEDGDLTIMTRGSLPPYPGVDFTKTAADLSNEQGTFGPGLGRGSFSFSPTLGAGMTRVVQFAGKNSFGGVMSLLGQFGTQVEGKTTGGGKWNGNFPTWGVTVVGASYGQNAKVSGTISFTSTKLTYPSVAVVTGFSWTTGTVSVEAAGGYGFQTALVRSGYDNRTSQGGGTIQMVAPRLTHWSGGAHWGDVAILNIKFVPEPEGWLMLAVGLGFIGATHRLRPKAD